MVCVLGSAAASAGAAGDETASALGSDEKLKALGHMEHALKSVVKASKIPAKAAR
jgi:hypothetical protein